MFADSLIDSDWNQHSRRGWTTLASFALQVLAVGALLALPFIYSQGLPEMLSSRRLVVSPTPTPHVQAAPSQALHSLGSISLSRQLTEPSSIPHTMATDTAVEPPGLPIIGSRNERGIAEILGSGRDIGVGPAISIPPPAVTHPPRVSHMMEGNLIYRVQPQYPAIARFAHIQGAVVLHAVISRTGAIENLQAVSGSPALVPSAIAAVRQWRYRPYVLNGEAVEVETQVTVNFMLAGGS